MGNQKGLSSTSHGFTFYNDKCTILEDVIHTPEGIATKYFTVRAEPSCHSNYPNEFPGLSQIRKYVELGSTGYSYSEPALANISDANYIFEFTNTLHRQGRHFEDADVLLEFISVTNTDTDHYQHLKDFFTEYGFLFSTNSTYTRYPYEPFALLIARMQFTLKIMNYVSQEPDDIDYFDLLLSVMYLIFHDPVRITAETSQGIIPIYESHKHFLYKYFVENLNFDETGAPTIRDMDTIHRINALSSKAEIYKSNLLHNEAQIEGLLFLIKLLQKKDIPDVYSTFHRDELLFFIAIMDYAERQCSETESLYDCIIKYGAKFLKLPENKAYRLALVDIAKQTLAEEISHNTKGIIPDYNATDLAGNWKIPNLLNAMYFSMFFRNASSTIIRKCANPTCSTYFSVLTSDKRRKYCSVQCGNTVNQRNARARKKRIQKLSIND